jgi:hypothetical protein
MTVTTDMPGCYTGQPNTYYLAAGKSRRTRLVVWTDAAGVESRADTADWWKLVNRDLWASGVRGQRWPAGTEISTYEGT